MRIDVKCPKCSTINNIEYPHLEQTCWYCGEVLVISYDRCVKPIRCRVLEDGEELKEEIERIQEEIEENERKIAEIEAKNRNLETALLRAKRLLYEKGG